VLKKPVLALRPIGIVESIHFFVLGMRQRWRCLCSLLALHEHSLVIGRHYLHETADALLPVG
jgi:hypothetical protein